MTADVFVHPRFAALVEQAVEEIRESDSAAETRVLVGMLSDNNNVSEDALWKAVKARVEVLGLEIVGMTE